MVVNYLNIGGPGNVPPTLIQALTVNSVVVSLSPQSTLDTSQAITHNFGLPASDISAGWPTLLWDPLDSLAQISNWFALSQNPNFTVLGRAGTTAGIDTANAQIQVDICRPHSLVR